jgi:uncharacterized protein DUF3606
LPSRRRNLREERDSHHRDAGGLKPAAVAVEIHPSIASKPMNRRKPIFFRNSLDLRDKVQVKVLRKRLRLSNDQFTSVIRKAGNSIAAITKEAAAK